MTQTAGTTSWAGADQGRHTLRHAPASSVSTAAQSSAAVGIIGVLALLLGAWGGIAPYLGPVFSWSPDGASAWHWALAPGILALAPGALAVVAALALLAGGRRPHRAGETGFLLAIAGAWFVIGPLAWRVLEHAGPYFVSASPLRELTYQVGANLGPGLIVLACGALAMGVAGRHPVATAGSPAAPLISAPVAPGGDAPGGVSSPAPAPGGVGGTPPPAPPAASPASAPPAAPEAPPAGMPG